MRLYLLSAVILAQLSICPVFALDSSPSATDTPNIGSDTLNSPSDSPNIVITPVRTASCLEGDRKKNIDVAKMTAIRKLDETADVVAYEFDLEIYNCRDLATTPIDFLAELVKVEMRASPNESKKGLEYFSWSLMTPKTITVEATFDKTITLNKTGKSRFGISLFPYGYLKESSHNMAGYSSTWIIDLVKTTGETKIIATSAL